MRNSELHLLPHSQLGEDTWHSLLIAMLRGMAALQVAAAHLRNEVFPGLRLVENPTLWYQGLAFFTGFAHQAVVVFFLISGWLVGGSLFNKLGQPDAIKLYAIDRITRLWTVLLPTFLLVLALGIVTGTLDPRSADFSPANPYSVSALAGNLAGLQTISVPQFGGNYPLWSLANETWYYIMFPLLLLGCTKRRAMPIAALLLIALLLPFAMTLYFGIWLLGAAFSRIRIDCSWRIRAALLLALAPMSVYFRFYGSNDDAVVESFAQDLLMSVVFLLFLSSTVVRYQASSRAVQAFRKGAIFFSNFSFTLYVVHVPVIHMLEWLGWHFLGRRQLAPDQLADLGLYLAMLGIIVGFAYGFYRLFEAHTYQVRRWLRTQLLSNAVAAARTAPAKR